MHPGESWFAAQGWTPHAYQRAAWAAFDDGADGLIHAPTGTGKTYAAWFGPLARAVRDDRGHGGARVLWITPLRALATDTVRALQRPLDDLGLDARVEMRTGDTSASARRRQRERAPFGLVTTPESLSVLLSYANAPTWFRHVDAIVVDEWHELIGSKRGVQTELGIAAVRRFAPDVRIWGLSATIGNLEAAAQVLTGRDDARLIDASIEKRIEIETLIPETVDRFPWSGHLGTQLLSRVIDVLHDGTSTLIFTNTRSQAEIWFRDLMRAAPELLGALAMHHGSLDRDIRREVERLLLDGRLRGVVCTSSLDLGIDFPPVDQVIQIGSPKGIARLMQRAGRSGHQPGAVSRIVGVPTNALELIEYAAVRDRLDAIDRGAARVEARVPIEQPIDVLIQHVVTRALGGGCAHDDLYAELRTTHAFRDLTPETFRWVMDFVVRGGGALGAYPEFRRVDDDDGTYRVSSVAAGRRHRLGIGTITSDPAVVVRFRGGRTVGTIEESFIARLRAGDHFVFSGRALEFLELKDLTAFVRPSRRRSGRVPRWGGGKSPLSTMLADAVRDRVDAARTDPTAALPTAPEMIAIAPLLALQAQQSHLPARDEILIESTCSDEGHHRFIFLLEGRLVHEGLASLLAHRLTRRGPISLDVGGTDWGVEIVSKRALPDDDATWRELLSTDALLDDLVACLDTTQLARRHFREIARIAGLIAPTYPGERRSARHVQASSNLFFDVFREHDPANLLLSQAQREVLDRELEVVRMRTALERAATRRLVLRTTERLTPFAFPIWADRLREQHVSSEPWTMRVQRELDAIARALDG